MRLFTATSRSESNLAEVFCVLPATVRCQMNRTVGNSDSGALSSPLQSAHCALQSGTSPKPVQVAGDSRMVGRPTLSGVHGLHSEFLTPNRGAASTLSSTRASEFDRRRLRRPLPGARRCTLFSIVSLCYIGTSFCCFFFRASSACTLFAGLKDLGQIETNVRLSSKMHGRRRNQAVGKQIS